MVADALPLEAIRVCKSMMHLIGHLPSAAATAMELVHGYGIGAVGAAATAMGLVQKPHAVIGLVQQPQLYRISAAATAIGLIIHACIGRKIYTSRMVFNFSWREPEV